MLTPIQKLIDEARDLLAQAAGKQVEIFCIEGAERAQREMYALTEARQAAAYAQAEISGGCYFLEQAGRDLPAMAKRQGA